jgi:hypothetical protein
VLKEGSPVYLGRDGPSGGRLLHPGVIVAMAQDRLTIEFENNGPSIQASDRWQIYYHEFQEFVQRRVQIEEKSKEGSSLRVVMKVIGDVVSTNTRQEYRVSTMDAGLTATLDTEADCAIQDISMSGLGLVSGRKYSIGQTLDMTFRFAEEDFSGRVAVQCIRELDGGRTRYGLCALPDDKDGDTLRIGLMRVALGIHREHLRRISGAA